MFFVLLAREIRHFRAALNIVVCWKLMCTSTIRTERIVVFSLQLWLHEHPTPVLHVHCLSCYKRGH